MDNITNAPQKKSKTVLKRTVVGLSLFAALMGAIFLTGISRFFIDFFIFVFSAVSFAEMIDLGGRKGMKPEIIPLAIGFLALYPMIYFFGGGGLLVTAGAELILLFGFYIFTQKLTFNDFAYSVFIFVYPVMLMSLAFLLIGEYGLLPVLIAAGAAMCSDTVAYYLGSLIGGPKIFPKISPKKTYAGSLSGLAGGAAGSLLVYFLFEFLPLPIMSGLKFSDVYSHPVLFYSLIGVAIAVVSEIGDLAASRIKRSLEIKDFSRLLGPQGGVMDRLDSILFALVFVAAYMFFAV
jgi:CDP-diglyceride synthetase